jgi:hypothetical protein
MISPAKVTPRCKHCGAKVWKVSSGLVCDACAAKIVPVKLYESQQFLPIDWSDVETIKGNGSYRKVSACQESLFEQNTRLSEFGLRQRTLFET